jgi:uncharacterized protein (DUF433 family)
MATQLAHDIAATNLIARDPAISWGKPVFAGTRVPVQALFDCLREGESLDGFLDAFPSVTREQAQAILELASQALRLNDRATAV